MTVRVYYSTDASAPVLSGAAGALIALFNACLVTGYGAKAGAGWTKPYSTGALVAVYRQGSGSNGYYLRVDDTGTGIGFNYGGCNARMFAYETMSDVNTGTNQFPQPQQVPNRNPNYTDSQIGGYFSKSNASDSTARPWVVIATEKFFWYWSDYANTRAGSIQCFGDFPSLVPGDTSNTCMISNVGHVTSASYNSFISGWNTLANSSANVGHYLAKSWTQIGGSQQFGKFIDMSKNLQYLPTQVDGTLWFQPWTITESVLGGTGNGIIRGTIPGCLLTMQTTYFAPYDIYVGTGTLAGRTYLSLQVQTWNSLLFEISDTW